jgi:serine/threonine protein kinase
MKTPKFEHVAKSLSGKLGYSFLRYVASGAFKETYEVQQVGGTKAALKVMDPAKCNLCRNEREMNSMKRCQHVGIARLLESGETFDDAGQSFYFSVEDFFDGGSLADRLKGGSLSVERAIEYGKHLAGALEHMASVNLVHRDIKPENIMFRDAAHDPILVDFGLVRDLSRSSLTQTWLASGPCTPLYASPEQLNNDKNLIDWRTDQFAVGVVMSYCITGKHPYLKEESASEVTAIESVAQREDVATWFKQFARRNRIEFLIKMLHAWPNRRFTYPTDLVTAFAERR